AAPAAGAPALTAWPAGRLDAFIILGFDVIHLLVGKLQDEKIAAPRSRRDAAALDIALLMAVDHDADMADLGGARDRHPVDREGSATAHCIRSSDRQRVARRKPAER